MAPEMILYLLALLVGASFGSFVTLVSYRLPLGEDIVFKPSRCPSCNTTLKALDLVPIFSWLFSRGHCRHCKTSIHVRYPLTETLLALVFLLITIKYQISVQTLLLCLMATALAVMIVTDFEHMIIPDSVQVALTVLGVLYVIYHQHPWEDVLLAVAVTGGTGLMLHYGYPLLRGKEGLGFGDVKFLAVIGLWIPLMAFPWFLFIAGMSGIATWAIRRAFGGGELFPFGPALAIALFINVFWPEMLENMLAYWHV